MNVHGVVVIEDFLAADQCDRLMAMIDRLATPSTVTGNSASSYRDNSRTSSTAHLDHGDPLVHDLARRMAELAGVPSACGEPIQGQRYDVGQEFREHFDFFHGAGLSHVGDLGNRSHTVIVYLNEEFSGGETEFPRLGLRIQPKRGMAVVWQNLDESGQGEQDMLHAGIPVTCGSKYILTRWFRERAAFRGVEDLPRCTVRGFDVVPVPGLVFDRVLGVYGELKKFAVRENDWGVLDATRGYAADMMSLDRVPDTRDFILHEMLGLHSLWSGERLVPRTCYGIRSYRAGASLKLHRDRVETHHISSIMIVDADNPDWALDIQDHAGVWHKICAKPGEMILYESAVCEHGRISPYPGEYFRNLFTHYSFAGWVYRG
jgi:prolyl 4-hydroxylase